MSKVALAYSGGLDTSVAIKWLKDNRGLDVVAVAVDVGQGAEMATLRRRALNAGAVAAYAVDVRDRFVRDFCFAALKANALYEGFYPLNSALSRPIISEELIRIARKDKCEWLAHGCTGKGNDQARFEAAGAALAPDLKVIAPVREWEFKTREDEIGYAEKHGIPVPVTRKSPYSIDRNIWGISVECGALEDPWEVPPEHAYQITVSPEKAPDKVTGVEIEFENGAPVGVNGKRLGPVELLSKLNTLGAANGVGRIDLVENRLVGIKSREVYEAPGATILLSAHRALEQLVLGRELMHLKMQMSDLFARVIYDGLWFSDLREGLSAFMDSTQRYVTGALRLRLYKGNCTVVGRRSPFSLYRHELATYSAGDAFEHSAATGFLAIRNLPLRAEGERRESAAKPPKGPKRGK